MSGALYNLAAMTVASSGTGSITLSSAATINGVTYLSFASAGVPSGRPIYYSILDNGQSEMGSAIYNSSNTTLTSRTPVTSTSSNAAIDMSLSALVLISPPTSQFLEVLSSAREFYISSAGSDSNTGLSSATPFLTIQKAIDTISNIIISTYAVNINLITSGTYSENVSVNGPWYGSGTVTLQGASTSTSSSYIINGSTAGTAITVQNGGRLTLKNVQVTTSSATAINTYGVRATAGAALQFGNVDFAVCGNAQIRSDAYAVIDAISNYTISAGGVFHLDASAGRININVAQVTLSSTPNYTTAFARAILGGGNINTVSSWNGTATGTRYSATLNGVINVAGASTTYLPGNSSGVTATGGQYA